MVCSKYDQLPEHFIFQMIAWCLFLRIQGAVNQVFLQFGDLFPNPPTTVERYS